MKKFFIKYCEGGHCVYSADGSVEQKVCTRCGKPIMSECASCGEKMSFVISSYVRAFESKPSSVPPPPKFCNSCGIKHPWTEAEIEKLSTVGIWGLLHPAITDASQKKFEDGHYDAAVDSAVKFLISTIGKNYKRISGEERDGVDLMRKAFGSDNPTIVLDDMATSTGRNIQEGYMNMFAGMVSAVRNPLAHTSVSITAEQATHELFLCSLLYSKFSSGRPRRAESE